jgi:uncharacterized OB-fold protein
MTMTSTAISAAGPDQAFAAHLAQGRFMLQRCTGCASHVFFPRVLCPSCGDMRLDWVPASGRATVYSATVVRRKPQHGGDYNVVLVDLAEGPRMMSRVEGIAPDAVRIGSAVQARIASSQGELCVVFDPVEAA